MRNEKQILLFFDYFCYFPEDHSNENDNFTMLYSYISNSYILRKIVADTLYIKTQNLLK